MSRRALSTVAIAGVVGVAVVAAVTMLGSAEEPPEPAMRTPGSPQFPDRVFDVRRGDPVNVVLWRQSTAKRCLAISGDPYLTSSFCPESSVIRSSGAYTVLSPVEGEAVSLVVGFLPSGAARAVATAGDSSAIGESRGPLFLVVLAPGALGPSGDEPVAVEFG